MITRINTHDAHMHTTLNAHIHYTYVCMRARHHLREVVDGDRDDKHQRSTNSSRSQSPLASLGLVGDEGSDSGDLIVSVKGWRRRGNGVVEIAFMSRLRRTMMLGCGSGLCTEDKHVNEGPDYVS